MHAYVRMHMYTHTYTHHLHTYKTLLLPEGELKPIPGQVVLWLSLYQPMCIMYHCQDGCFANCKCIQDHHPHKNKEEEERQLKLIEAALEAHKPQK